MKATTSESLVNLVEVRMIRVEHWGTHKATQLFVVNLKLRTLQNRAQGSIGGALLVVNPRAFGTRCGRPSAMYNVLRKLRPMNSLRA